MGAVSIPVAIDGDGNTVPIEEAIPRQPDLYRCPECRNKVYPAKGTQQAHHYRHAKGELDDDNICPLSSKKDVEDLVETLRTSSLETAEKNRKIGIHVRRVHGEWLELIGVLPTLDWSYDDSGIDIDTRLPDVSIETEGTKEDIDPAEFHPAESEVSVELDPHADQFSIQVDNADSLSQIRGRWTGYGLSEGDIFIGSHSRARRSDSDRQVKTDDWIYAVTEEIDQDLPEIAEVYSLGEFRVIGFPVTEATQSLLDQFVDTAQQDRHGYDADIILPGWVDPTTREPIILEPNTPILLGVLPTEDIDPYFEIIPVPKDLSDPIELKPTGPGNPRFHRFMGPEEGSQRFTVHQRNSSRHRPVHLHATSSAEDVRGANVEAHTMIEVTQAGKTSTLNPLGESELQIEDPPKSRDEVPEFEYIGPDGLAFDVEAEFTADSPLGPILTRRDLTADDVMSELRHWIGKQCTAIKFRFDGIGTISVRINHD